MALAGDELCREGIATVADEQPYNDVVIVIYDPVSSGISDPSAFQ